MQSEFEVIISVKKGTNKPNKRGEIEQIVSKMLQSQINEQINADHLPFYKKVITTICRMEDSRIVLYEAGANWQSLTDIDLAI